MPCEQDPDLWFPDDLIGDERELVEKLAVELCKACPLKKPCATYAIESQQEFGIWGGTLPSDRL